MRYTEVVARTLINDIPHSRFSVVKGLSCRSSMNTAFGCETSCSYCYIRYLSRWKGMEANDIFRNVSIRINAPELLDRELSRRKAREWIWIGSASDPYQAFEERYGLMRGCLQALAKHRQPFEIITKSSLVARDAGLLSACGGLGVVSMSLFGSLDDEKRSHIELKADGVQERIEALAQLNAAGVPTVALLLPILPGWCDDPREIREVLQAVRRAGTMRVYAGVLRLSPSTWGGMRQMMSPRISHLRERYQNEYFGPGSAVSAGARVPSRVWRRRLMGVVSRIACEEGFAQFSCEENFYDLWFGPQDEHGHYRYAVPYDFYLERLCREAPLDLDAAVGVARRFFHTPSYLASVEKNLSLLNWLADPASVGVDGDG
jgi:DNA repair photolyase